MDKKGHLYIQDRASAPDIYASAASTEESRCLSTNPDEVKKLKYFPQETVKHPFLPSYSYGIIACMFKC